MNIFKTDFSEYHILETEDNSSTLYSSYFSESCHSKAGAKGETLYNYIEGCLLSRFLGNNSKDFSILEVGFGTGLGFIEVIKYLKKYDFKKKLYFLSVEIDKGLIEYFIKEMSDQFPFLLGLKLIKDNRTEYYFLETENINLKILIGDATVTLLELEKIGVKKFDAVFQDAFSPKKNPELWTRSWFSLIYKYCSEDVVLSTYSSAGGVKKALKESGFFVHERPGFKLKKTSTIATKTKIKG